MTDRIRITEEDIQLTDNKLGFVTEERHTALVALIREGFYLGESTASMVTSVRSQLRGFFGEAEVSSIELDLFSQALILEAVDSWRGQWRGSLGIS